METPRGDEKLSENLPACAVGIYVKVKAQNSLVPVAPSSTAALPWLSGFGRYRRDTNWGDENPPEWRIIFQPGFIPFRCVGLRFAGFARTSDFQADRHSGRSARGCRRNGFSYNFKRLFSAYLCVSALNTHSPWMARGIFNAEAQRRRGTQRAIPR